MKRLINAILAFSAVILIVFACGKTQKENELSNNASAVKAIVDSDTVELKPIYNDTLEWNSINIEGLNEKSITGQIKFREINDGKLTMTVDIEGAAPGKHAIHIHENGDCSAKDGSSAGGHWNPTDSEHGERGESEEFHRGDIGNITVGEDGTGSLTVVLPNLNMGGNGVYDIMGKAIIIHADADDFTSQPGGDAGMRIGCAVIN